MKRFGLFLLKNNIHLMTLVFVGWAVWAAFVHQSITTAVPEMEIMIMLLAWPIVS